MQDDNLQVPSFEFRVSSSQSRGSGFEPACRRQVSSFEFQVSGSQSRDSGSTSQVSSLPAAGRFPVSCFSTAYLPPVSYFLAMLRSERVELEAHENFVKQSYRNRCRIATANGVETLSIPIESNKGEKLPIREARIAPHDNWQQNHWRAITSAYRNSPFFDYYEDDFRKFYEKKWTFLWEYNQELLTLVLELLDIDVNIHFTAEFQANYKDANDFREIIHPKKETILHSKPYYQVFENKHGFLPDLSIIDLLFNMGNESVFYLLPEYLDSRNL